MGIVLDIGCGGKRVPVLLRLFEQYGCGWKSAKSASMLISCGYFVVVAFALSKHEMWRDEIQPWLIARDSESIHQLLRNLQYENHPVLWQLLLMPLTRISPSPELMQVLHLCIATSIVYIVTRYSPLSCLQLLLFPLGFFTAWQYSVVSRDYAIGILFLVIFCALYPRRNKLFPLIGAVLMLAANTHALVLLLVIAISIGLAVEMWMLLANNPDELDSKRIREVIGGFGLIVLGIITSLVQLVPRNDYEGPTTSTFRSLRDHAVTIGSISFLGGTLFLFLLYHFRDRLSRLILYGLGAIGVVLYFDAKVLGAIPGAPGIRVFALIGLAAYLFMLYQLRGRLSLLIIYGLGTAGLLVFFSGISSGGPHHHGMLFVIYFIAYWLECLTRSKACDPMQSWWDRNGVDLIFTLVLISQSVFGIKALYQDITTPYSNGKDVARYIQSQGLQDLPIAGCIDYSASTVVGYLGVKQIYYPQGERWGSYIVWDKQRLENAGLDNCLQSAASLGSDVLVVSSYTRDSPLSGHPFRKIAEFRGALREDENFDVYRGGHPVLR